MKTSICIASGPSLTKEDVDYCQGKGKIYVVKECHHLAPWADVLYCGDTDWWENQNGVPEFKGQKWTVSAEASKKFGLNYIAGYSQIPWSMDNTRIATGENSGFQMANLAAVDDPPPERIILLGYDMGHGTGKDKHWWEKMHPRESRASNYARWLKLWNKAAPLIPMPILNASRESAITCFPRVNLRDVL